MATLKTNTLTGTSTAGSIAVTGEGNSTTTNLQQGLAKQWCHYDGEGTPTIAGSFNVSSLNDLGTGTFQQVCTNNFADANYSVTAMTREENGFHFIVEFDTTHQRTTALIFTSSGDKDGNVAEVDGRSVTVHGDLA